MLNEYIKELIASNNRVIIPNFGAFLLRATSKNKNKKDLASKIEDIYFSPFLKFNDELLVNHIMKKEELDQKASLEKINEYIKTIEDSVKKDGVFSIEGLGEFYQDAQGKIQFKINPSGGKQESSEQKEEKKAEETKTQTSKKEADKSAKKTVNEKASSAKSASAKQETQKSSPKQPEQSKDKQKATTPQASKQKAASQPKAATSAKQTSEKKKTNKGLVLSIAIGVPVAAIFIWAMLNFDTVNNLFSKDGDDKQKQPVAEKVDKAEEGKKGKGEQKGEKDTEGEQTTNKKQKDTKAQSDKQVDKDTQASKDKATATSGTKGKKFYIVAGSFRKKQNAINFRKKLQDQGYNSELIGERNGMHAVSYDSFQSKAKAQAELSAYRKKGIQAWLLYY
jgi:nucleoid DNA-binding protein